MGEVIPIVDWKRAKAVARVTTAGSPSESRRHLADMLRAAVGFRVDGPDGRVGMLTAVGADGDDGLPGSIQIATGMFVVRSVQIPFADVVGVDPVQRRVGVRVGPERGRASRREIARRIHRFLRNDGK